MDPIITQVMNTIQGEGVNIGKPMTFIRLGNCNLQCPFCDSKWSNNIDIEYIKKHQIEIDGLKFPEIMNLYNSGNYFDYIKNKNQKYKHLLITGGEPFLNQEFIIDLIKYVNPDIVEFETNGIIFPDKILKFIEIPIVINISPKFDINCYDDFIYIPKDPLADILSSLLNHFIINQTKYTDYINVNIFWKFIHASDNGEKIIRFIDNLKINNKTIYIMPLTPHNIYNSRNFKKFEVNCKETLKFCMENNFKYTPRLQNFLFKTNTSKFSFTHNEYDVIEKKVDL